MEALQWEGGATAQGSLRPIAVQAMAIIEMEVLAVRDGGVCHGRRRAHHLV